jgi:phage gpG-like protein
MSELFKPRDLKTKRTLSTLPGVRINEEEKRAVEQLIQVMSHSLGRDLSVSDIVRIAVGRLFEQEVEAKVRALRQVKKDYQGKKLAAKSK